MNQLSQEEIGTLLMLLAKADPLGVVTNFQQIAAKLNDELRLRTTETNGAKATVGGGT